MNIAGPGRDRSGRAQPCLMFNASRNGSKSHLPTRGRDVQGFPCLQIDPGGHDVNVDSATRLVVPDGGPGIAVGFQSGPGQAFKVVQHFLNLLSGRVVRRRPGNDAGSQSVFEVQGVGNLAHAKRVAAQHFNVFSWPALVILVVLRGSRQRPRQMLLALWNLIIMPEQLVKFAVDGDQVCE